MPPLVFDDTFRALTGHPPFPWQRALYAEFAAGHFPKVCNLPTGLGKTHVIAVWLIALANAPLTTPRRLVYVVNRRTVVDQTTVEVEKYRANAEAAGLPWPLALSTLRGQFADNRAWSADPSVPAVVCGTVDMIGSRLLFSGYGVGFKSKPLHAGFLGQDALLVHDEAHLEPAFQRLLTAIEAEQGRCEEHKFGKFRVMELSATSRSDSDEKPFGLGNDDFGNAIVNARINAVKALQLHGLDDEKKLAEVIAAKALTFKDKDRAVVVFLRRVEDVEKVVAKLPKDSTRQLTGTLRGLERDELVESPIFRRFKPEPGGEVAPGTVYLVCTSAGEVGVDLSADDMVCDLSTFDSMAQRLGRLNRYGRRDDSTVHVYHPKTFEADKPFDQRRKLTLALLEQLGSSASPAALNRLDPAARLAAFAPLPEILPVSDILFDAWSLTTVRGKLPGRPEVEPYLHGVSDSDPPQTTIAWRDEVELLTPALLESNGVTAEEALELFPLKPHETLSLPTYGKGKAVEQLTKLAGRHAGTVQHAWVVSLDGTVEIYTLDQLVETDGKRQVVSLANRTVLLAPNVGGLAAGLLAGDAKHDSDERYDVSQEWYSADAKRSRRRWRKRLASDSIDSDSSAAQDSAEMRQLDVFNLKPEAEDSETPQAGCYWHWYARPDSADQDGPGNSITPVTWQDHTDQVVKGAECIVAALKLPTDLAKAVVLAARLHDLGKLRAAWQRSIGSPGLAVAYAKSAKGWRGFRLPGYRHELGSLFDAVRDRKAELDALIPGMRDVVLHLVAAHHGRARPHFPEGEDIDLPPGLADPSAVAEVPRRFARLQRTYGRWGLAYLESLLRAADIAASAKPTRPKGVPS